MTGRPRQFDESEARERVMESFWANGYDGTNFDTLVRDSGLSRSSLYAAFGGKDELFRQSLERYLGCFHDEFLDEFFGGGREGLKEFLKTWDQPVDPEDRGCLLQKVILENATSAAPRQVEIVESRLAKIWKAIRRALRGVERPARRAKMTSDEKAAMLVAMMFGVSVIARNGRNEDLVKALARGAVKFVDAES